jgi:hypothetical protein
MWLPRDRRVPARPSFHTGMVMREFILPLIVVVASVPCTFIRSTGIPSLPFSTAVEPHVMSA